MRLSVCLIVKNEALHLSDCLASVQEIADEIIVVDTGSEDESATIAQGFGARLFFKKWNDDFSEARNFALRQALGQWILLIDADERLDTSSVPVIKQILTSESALKPQVFNGLILSGKPSGFYKRALFPNLPGFRFEGVVHEQLYYEGSVPEQWHASKLILHHLPRAFDQKKQQYYLALIQSELKKPLSAEQKTNYYKHLGDSYLLLKQQRLALDAYLEADLYFEKSSFKPSDIFFAHLMKPLIQLSLSLQNDPEHAFTYSSKCVQFHPELTEAWCYFSYTAFLTGRLSLAKKTIIEMFEFKRGPVALRWLIVLQLTEARCYTQEKKYTQASEILTSLYQVHPHKDILAHHSFLLLIQQQFQKALNHWSDDNGITPLMLINELMALPLWSLEEKRCLLQIRSGLQC